MVVFAAASLKNGLDEIAGHWRCETGKRAIISYGGSNTLIKQIEKGAPADIFFSADLEWMDYGQQKDLIKPESRFNLLGKRLALIARREDSRDAFVNIQQGFDLVAIAASRERGQGPELLTSGFLTPPSPPAERTTARRDQARQSRTDDGTRGGHAGERKARVKWSLLRDVGADPLPVGLQVLISYPGLKIAGEERRPCCRQQYGSRY